MSFHPGSASQVGRGYPDNNLNTRQPVDHDTPMNTAFVEKSVFAGEGPYISGAVSMASRGAGYGQSGQQHPSQAQANGGVATVREKSRTSCNFCTSRKKRCDYVEINGQKQPCSLCKSKHRECVFDKKPPRKTGGASLSTGASKKTKSGGSRSGGNRTLAIRRPNMGPSPATGLVGLEENIFLSDFFDRLGFFPISNQSNIQKAIMEVLFRPAIEDASRREAEKGSTSESAGDSGTDTSHSLSLAVRGPETLDLDGVLGGAAALRRRWELQESSKAFSCMLWCTIAMGALTSNLRTTTVKQYVKLAEEAIDGLWSPDVATAKAYVNMSMLYAFLDKEEHFDKHLSAAKELIQAMDDDPQAEDVPLDVRDMVNELDRILALHYSDDMDVIKRCCYSADKEPAQMSPFLVCDSGLFHMVRFYTDGVFKAFWRDVLKRDPVLSETKKFSEKHRKQCLDIERIAKTRPDLRNTGGGLYIRTAMQFMRLPLKTDPRQMLRSSIDLANVICKVPGMIRLGPVKHYVHCLVMGLSRPAMAGIDEGAYEKLRVIYNGLDIAGPPIVGAEDMEIANLCKHPFCKGMAWSHQQKAIRQMKEAAAAVKAQAQTQAQAACARFEAGSGAMNSVASASAVAAVGGRSRSPQAGSATGSPTSSAAAAAASSYPVGVSSSSSRISTGSADAIGATGSSDSGRGSGSGSFSPQQVGPTAPGIGSFFCDPISQQRQQQQQSASHANASLAASFEDGAGFFVKQESPRAYPSQGRRVEPLPPRVGGEDTINSAHSSGRDPPFYTGVAWQQQRQQRGDNGLAAENLMTPHQQESPSVPSFLSQSRLPQQQDKQQQHQSPSPASPSPFWAARGAAGASISSGSSVSSAPASALAATGIHDPHDGSAEMPVDVYAYAQQQVHQQVHQQSAERERGANVQNLHDLLLVNDDDRGEVPDMYEGESDAEDFESLALGGVDGGFDGVTNIAGEGLDESLSSLAAQLLNENMV